MRRWKPRREATGPKTIEQIHREAAKEGIVMGAIPPPRGGPIHDPGATLVECEGMMADPRDRRSTPVSCDDIIDMAGSGSESPISDSSARVPQAG